MEHVTQEELLTWMAFYGLEPWGCHVEDQRAEAQLQLTYAINRKPGAPIPRFLERDRPPPKPQTADELEDSIRDFFAGRTTNKKKRRRKDQRPAQLSSEKGGEVSGG